VHAGCWAHARRKFFDAVKLNSKDQTAIGIVAQMDQIFAVDAQAWAQRLTQSDRHLLREQKARPLLEQIKGAIQAARVQALAKQCPSQGLQLYPDALGSTDPLSRLPAIGVEQ
jgi:transposase